MLNLPRYWAGTPESLQAYIESVAKLMDSDVFTKRADYMDPSEDPKDCPDLYQLQGEIGVVTIKGALTNTDSWMNAFIGVTSYSQIREAMIYAANDPAAKAIVLDIGSGGGAVAGMSDTADLIATIDTRVKPVYSFTDSLMASAAYSLGVSARSISIGKMAEAGSVGVLIVHREVSKMMADSGITTTVIRSGKWKALGNSAEPLSELAHETLQAQVDKLSGLFVEHVAACRKKSVAQVEASMGGGRVFIGSDAVDVGLVDAIASFDAFMSAVATGIDKSNDRSQYGANSLKGHQQVKTALTEQQIVEATAAPAATVPAVPAAAPEAAAPAPNADVVALLQTQLATAQAQVLQLSVDMASVKTAKDAAEASAEKLRPVVRAAVGVLRVALGGAAAGVEALTDDNLMAEHANLSVQFNAKFPAGGVAAVSSSAVAGSADSDATSDPLRAARLAATRNSK